jgi:hypothetical protein
MRADVAWFDLMRDRQRTNVLEQIRNRVDELVAGMPELVTTHVNGLFSH